MDKLSVFINNHTLTHIPNVDSIFYGGALTSTVFSALLFVPFYAARRVSLRAATNNERQRLEEFAGDSDAESHTVESDDHVAEEEDDETHDSGGGNDQEQPRRDGRGFNDAGKSNDRTASLRFCSNSEASRQAPASAVSPYPLTEYVRSLQPLTSEAYVINQKIPRRCAVWRNGAVMRRGNPT